ncbi:MAG: DUF1365 domain-containing protein [Bacteriovoracaceae bacterium]|nr:DUF1365 domain-containing protein [Bacteriovoracaceae bacterium]
MKKAVILRNTIYHKRFLPVEHVFTYEAFSLRFSIYHVEELKKLIFGFNQFSLFSIHLKDYLFDPAKSFEEKFHSFAKKHALELKKFDEILLQTFPRVLGYGFNPVCFWMTYHKGELQQVLAEVNNTFGEKHCYFIENPHNSEFHLEKCFHVSPFFSIEGEYQFTFKENYVGIDLIVNNKKQIATFIKSKEIPYTTQNLLGCFIKFPFASFVIMGKIHWQALLLWWKKVPFFTKPKNPPNKEVTS